MLASVIKNFGKQAATLTNSRLEAAGELARRNQRLVLLGDDDATAERNYIRGSS
jgi:hypothetical protein